MFTKRQSAQPGQYIQVAIGGVNREDESSECYCLMLNRDFAVSRPNTVILQVMTTNPAAVEQLLLRRLWYTRYTLLPFGVMCARVLRTIADLTVIGGGAIEPPPWPMVPPCTGVCHTTRADVVGAVQSIDGRAFMIHRKQMIRAFPPVPTRPEYGVGDQPRTECDENGADANGDPVYTIDECNALMLDSLRWRAQSWVRNHPPTALSSRYMYYRTYASCNKRHLERRLFDLVVEERYEKLRYVDSNDGAGTAIWSRR